jgi:hypothetical protein
VDFRPSFIANEDAASPGAFPSLLSASRAEVKLSLVAIFAAQKEI